MDWLCEVDDCGVVVMSGVSKGLPSGAPKVDSVLHGEAYPDSLDISQTTSILTEYVMGLRLPYLTGIFNADVVTTELVLQALEDHVSVHGTPFTNSGTRKARRWSFRKIEAWWTHLRQVIQNKLQIHSRAVLRVFEQIDQRTHILGTQDHNGRWACSQDCWCKTKGEEE